VENLKNIDWTAIGKSLDARGFVRVKHLLSHNDCKTLANLYADEKLFRSTINMERYRFGQGEYKYFSYPLPPLVQSLRTHLYRRLAPLANEWMNRLSIDIHYPDELEKFLAHCHAKDQHRPTPLVLRYESGGYNTLHQDMYGEVYFPFQVVFVLADPAKDYDGGELVFVEQLPRAQSRVEVLNPAQGDAVIFTTNFRPVQGTKGYFRAKMKHGVSSVKKGLRFSMGLIFHDAA
jgi:uncharacterized protein